MTDATHLPDVHLRGVLADRDAWSAELCSMDRAVQLVGRRSDLLLLREAFYGSTRFDEFVRRTGLSEPVVAARLRRLVAAGLLVRVPYREAGERERLGYALTPMGDELLGPVVALLRWGDRWLAPDGPPIVLEHSGCGAAVDVTIRCAAGHTVGAGGIDARVGPGVDRPHRGRAGPGDS